MRRFTADCIALRRAGAPLLRDARVGRVCVHADSRVIAYSLDNGRDTWLVVASFGDTEFAHYDLPAAGAWREIFNSNSRAYGGSDSGNAGATLGADGRLSLRLPAQSFLVFKKVC
jgi:1,4-alpha-glucan branching enzyme